MRSCPVLQVRHGALVLTGVPCQPCGFNSEAAASASSTVAALRACSGADANCALCGQQGVVARYFHRFQLAMVVLAGVTCLRVVRTIQRAHQQHQHQQRHAKASVVFPVSRACSTGVIRPVFQTLGCNTKKEHRDPDNVSLESRVPSALRAQTADAGILLCTGCRLDTAILTASATSIASGIASPGSSRVDGGDRLLTADRRPSNLPQCNATPFIGKGDMNIQLNSFINLSR